MSKEKVVLTAINFRRVFENRPQFTVFRAKKNESHPHSSFLGGLRSKVIFRVTRKYLALRGSIPHTLLPAVALLSELYHRTLLIRCGRSHLPTVGGFAVARVQPSLRLYPISITLKHKSYGR